MAGEKIINFKLDAQTIEKLTKQKSLHVAYRKSGVLELVMDDARIRLDTMKGSTSPRAADATYFNNNSSTLHYLGATVVATPTIRKIQEDKKPKSKDSAEQRDKVARLLDIPSTAAPSSETKSKTTSSLKKSSSSKKSKSSSNIPPPHTPTTPLSASSSSSSRAAHKTSKSLKSFDPPVTKTTAPSEEKYSMKSRILQRLAIQPWSLIEMTKSLNRSQLERCEQLEVKHILDMVAFPIKKDERKKFCLKPKHYKDIQIWTWPFYSNEDKKIAAENAKEAYDLLQSQGVDSDRSNLYHPDSPYKPPASPMLANGKKIASPLNSRKTSSSSSSSSAQQQQQQQQQQLERGKGRLTPVDHASPSTPLMKLAASPLQNKPITPTPPSSTMTPPPLPSSSQSTPTQHHLKPSSANKKYASKALPQQNGTMTSSSASTTPTEKLSPPTKRKNMVMDDVDVPSRDTLTMPTPRHKKRAKESAAASIPSTHTPPISKSSKMPLPTLAAPAPAPAAAAPAIPPPPVHKEPTSIKPLNIKSQHKFNAYCHSYVKQQKDYVRIKRFFKSNFPQYIQVLQSTEPPKGTKRSYYDLNAEYQAMLKANYLKQGDDEQDFKEAQAFLVDCNNKRRRLNYMWTSIKQNLDEHQYTIPKNVCK